MAAGFAAAASKVWRACSTTSVSTPVSGSRRRPDFWPVRNGRGCDLEATGPATVRGRVREPRRSTRRDFNTQLTAWLNIANRRQHRTLGARPIDRWEADRAQMLALPPVDPPRWWRFATRVSRDHYIRVDTCDYSVHPLAIGKKAQVRTDTDEVIVTLTPG
ncbi:Mu transposase domain-containing protein [Streptomyces sp. NPDC097107]|uniref:Mu transposase domain-containing protein n=1 Tax=Streptomyces sp. NPDC097107 TaxID=3366089 RepID=UPI00381CFFF8